MTLRGRSVVGEFTGPMRQCEGRGVGVEIRSSEKGMVRCCRRGCSAEAESADGL